MKLIVVIEDNRDNRLLVSSLLSDFYATTENQTGFEIFCGLQDKILELILLDISLRNQCRPRKWRIAIIASDCDKHKGSGG